MRFLSPVVEKAYYFSKDAHAGQLRKNGKEYFSGHVERVYNWLLDHYRTYIPPTSFLGKQFKFQEMALCAALLHDVVEDYEHTGIDESDIMINFGFDIKDLVMVLTRKPDQIYFDYIKEIKEFSPLAVAVKLSDLEINMLDHYKKEKTGSRYSKYLFSKHYLLS